MKHPLLKAEKRTVLGKKIKKLRREGWLPANTYGKNIPSVALQVKLSDFTEVRKEAGDTGVIDLEFDGKTKPVMVKNLQMNYQTHLPLHADFYQVNLKQKVKSMIPLVVVGEPKAVVDKVGQLLQTASEIEVEALPEELPESIEVTVDRLAEIDDQVTVEELKAPEGVTILTDPGQVVAKIAEQQQEEPEPEPVAEEEGETQPAETAEETTEAPKEEPPAE